MSDLATNLEALRRLADAPPIVVDDFDSNPDAMQQGRMPT